jgi:phosphomannomutase/phosphoglucomutase
MGIKQVNPQIFRQYDIRGLVVTDLDADVMELLGRSFASYVSARGAANAAVGHDNRETSPEYQAALIEGMRASGIDVVDIGQAPTPAMYYAVLKLQKDAGATVTASHNPPKFNGLKMRLGERAVFGDGIQELRSLVERGDFSSGEGGLEKRGIKDDYIDNIVSRTKMARSVKVVVDCGNGTTGPFAVPLLKKLGCEVIELYTEPDGTFPNHLPDPTVEKYLTDLSARVRSEGAELGIAYDGDGDRLGVLDERGKIVWADRLMVLFARQILPKHPGASVVFDTKCSLGLIEEIEKLGGAPVMWKTGYPLIQSKMLETSAPMAGEMSGHLYFADEYHSFDDALYASCRVLSLVSALDGPFSKAIETVPDYPSTPEIRTKCPDDKKFEVIERMKALFREKYETIEIDGVRAQMKDGWALIRASNTEPVIVLRFEARSESRLKEIMDEVRGVLASEPSVEADF